MILKEKLLTKARHILRVHKTDDQSYSSTKKALFKLAVKRIESEQAQEWHRRLEADGNYVAIAREIVAEYGDLLP